MISRRGLLASVAAIVAVGAPRPPVPDLVAIVSCRALRARFTPDDAALREFWDGYKLEPTPGYYAIEWPMRMRRYDYSTYAADVFETDWLKAAERAEMIESGTIEDVDLG